MQFMAYMKTPQYKASLQQLLEQEKVGLIFNISNSLELNFWVLTSCFPTIGNPE